MLWQPVIFHRAVLEKRRILAEILRLSQQGRFTWPPEQLSPFEGDQLS